MKNRTVYIVKAIWDDEAKVWCAEGINLPGLATYGENLDILMKKLDVMIPELLEANHELENGFDVPFELLVERSLMAQRNYA
jgi:hypothetical protein